MNFGNSFFIGLLWKFIELLRDNSPRTCLSCLFVLPKIDQTCVCIKRPQHTCTSEQCPWHYICGNFWKIGKKLIWQKNYICTTNRKCPYRTTDSQFWQNCANFSEVEHGYASSLPGPFVLDESYNQTRNHLSIGVNSNSSFKRLKTPNNKKPQGNR